MKKNNKKGFTLAELLIVVAIIAVLVAIAIPIFTNQLEKSREATDAANIRDYYAEIATALVSGDLDYAKSDTMTVSGGKAVTVSTPLTDPTGTFTVTVTAGVAKQTVSKWQTGDIEVAGFVIEDDVDMKGKSNILYTFTVTEDNTYLSGIAFS